MKTVARIVAAVVVLTVAVGAQPKPKPRPDFSGRWTVVNSKDDGQVEIVTQPPDGKTLTTEHASEGGGHKMTYQLDGVERRLAIPGRTDITMLATAAWDGDHIVISTKISYPNGMKTQSKEVWSIDEKGQRVVDYTENGPTGPGPTQKVVYVKK
jgi:hypothetical protein